MSLTVCEVSGTISIRAEPLLERVSGSPASRTRPIEVTNAGRRVPTASVIA